ncbi:amino acid ABC transporter permease [Herbaspirillum sp. LeCh32-8]|uniref:amino acid ABC transporter permease n=1 Tax=Herbaspirillum sp. LeCh32-8 TaxID=2821356 RepID=UPI001AE61E33|nr:amino acid ABC transporter permease [Herbaspirillum sp. LeCh32-8]MBP0597364.1 amino acid ABC transporter permease [Herbaspirillum sp. LeCh32-8]
MFGHLLAPKYLYWMWQGFLTTLWLTAMVAVLATLFGMLLAAARSARTRWIHAPAAAYTSLFRNTPLLVQLLFWYFGVPSFFPEGAMDWLNADHVLSLFGPLALRWPSFEFLAALCGLVFYTTAYVGEEIRSGIRGVAPGQALAGAAIGMTRWQVLRHVVLPQAIRLTLPSLLGQYMNILKNTSLTMGIGLAELSYASRQVESETFLAFQAFGVATLLYIAAIAVIESAGHLHLRARRQRQGRA